MARFYKWGIILPFCESGQWAIKFSLNKSNDNYNTSTTDINYQTFDLLNILLGGSQPNLSQYFGDANDGASVSSFTGSASFFDQLSPSNVSDERGEDVVESLESRETAVLHSCRESRVDLPNLAALQIDDKQTSATSGAKIDVAEQGQTLKTFFFD